MIKKTYVPSPDTFITQCICGKQLIIDLEGVILHQMPPCKEYLKDQPAEVFLRKVRLKRAN